MFHFLSCADDYEEPDYKILQKQEKKNIEIREYPSIIIAEVKMKDKKKETRSESFRKLFKYITGANEQDQTIEMTIPVFQAPTDSSQWSMSFVIPKKWEWGKVPQPVDDEISIKQLESQKMAAIRFEGRGSEENFSKYQKVLEQYLIENNIKYDKDKPVYAYYSSPWVLWFMRKHEVLFVVEIEESPNSQSESQEGILNN